MTTPSRRLCAFLLLALSGAAFAAGDTSGISRAQPPDPDYTRATAAIKEKQWDEAIAALNRVVANSPSNADAYNLLGYSERMRGQLDRAFKHYEKALALDPKHRGAHEYVGEAYLLANDLAKAEEHLKALDRLCFFGCTQYDELKAKIAEYKAKNPAQAASGNSPGATAVR